MNTMEEQIILVDKHDQEIGIEEKIWTHQKGLLHRAFSIFIFNSKDELLIQKRALTKYHSGGLWTNTCCGHPRAGEDLIHAAHRRLREEMGFDCNIIEVFSFIYQVKFSNNLLENEYDHVFMGRYDGVPNPNPAEIDDWKWIFENDLRDDLRQKNKSYTCWFLKIVNKVIKAYKKVENTLEN
jgi:isopentenyl-diphosphate delta-isomerase